MDGLKNIKLEYLFYEPKKILHLYLRWWILRSYHFAAEVTFKGEHDLLTLIKVLWTTKNNSFKDKTYLKVVINI